MDSASASSVSSSTPRPEFTSNLLGPVTSLKDLSTQIKTTSFSFSPLAIRNIEEILHCLKDLDAKRLVCHEELESCTIKTSIIRHELSNFPDKLQAEIKAKVKAARESNMDQIYAIQEKVSQIAEIMLESIRKQELLDMHNKALQFERTDMVEKHDELVVKINKVMAEKSGMQIMLHDIQTELKDTLNKIAVEKKDISEIEIEQERARITFAEDLKKLYESVETSEIKCELKEEEMRKSNTSLEEIKDRVFRIRLEMDTKTEELNQLESSIVKQQDIEIKFKRQLAKGADEMNRLTVQCKDTRSEIKKIVSEYATKGEAILTKTGQINAKIEVVLEELRKVSLIQKGLKRDLRNANTRSNLQASSLGEAQKSIKQSRKLLLDNAEEGARIKKDYGGLVKHLQEMKDYHEAKISLLKDNINGLEDNYVLHKKMCNSVMVKCRNIEEFNESYAKKRTEEINRMQTKASSAKCQYTDMSKQIEKLEKSIEEKSAAIQTKTQCLRSAKHKLTLNTTSLMTDILGLEETVEDYKDELDSRNETLLNVEHQHLSLKKELEEKTDFYQTKAKLLIALRSQNEAIEEKVKMVGKDLVMVHTSQANLKMDSLRCRAYTRLALRQQNKEVEAMEKEVVETSQRFLVINGENEKIIEAKDQLSKEIEKCLAYLKSGEDTEAHLIATIKLHKEMLVEKLKLTKELEKVSSGRDEVILKDISKIREASEDRLPLMRAFHEKFDDELQSFNSYLETSIL